MSGVIVTRLVQWGVAAVNTGGVVLNLSIGHPLNYVAAAIITGIGYCGWRFGMKSVFHSENIEKYDDIARKLQRARESLTGDDLSTASKLMDEARKETAAVEKRVPPAMLPRFLERART